MFTIYILYIVPRNNILLVCFHSNPIIFNLFVFSLTLDSYIPTLNFYLGKASMEKKTFSFGHCPNDGGGGLPLPEFFGPLFRSAFLVNKKSLFPQKCQCIELLTVF